MERWSCHLVLDNTHMAASKGSEGLRYYYWKTWGRDIAIVRVTGNKAQPASLVIPCLTGLPSLWCPVFFFICRMDYSVFLHKMEEKHFSVSHIIQNSAWAFPFSWAINCLSQKILSVYLFCCSLVANSSGCGRCSIVSTFSTHLCGRRGTSCRWFQIFFSPHLFALVAMSV